MYANYRLRRLTPERIPEAFPVVAVVDQEITAPRWSDYARTIAGADGQDGGRGILTLEDRQGRIVGLSAYAIRPDLHCGRVLSIEIFAVVTLIGAQQAAAMLLAALERLARDRACRCLAVSLPRRKAGGSPGRDRSLTGRYFERAGFRPDLTRLSKCLDPRPAGNLETAASGRLSGSPDLRP